MDKTTGGGTQNSGGRAAFGDTGGLLTAVMASCRDAIIACSLDGTIEAWNLGAEQIYGFRADQALGRDASLTVPAGRRDELRALVAAAREGRSIEHFDTVRVRQSGEAFPAAVCGFPIHAPGGRVVGYATVERDISDRVRAADALRQALGEAREASHAKSRFLANASHELRTPMNAIVGMTALALEENISDELREYLQTIRESADAMLHLINDVLDLAKFESDRFELDEATFDPRDVLEGTVKALAAAAHAKGLELVCNVAPDMPAGLVGDPVRLRQILTNLVGNAIKFTEQGDVIVEVSPVAVEKEHCRARFRVADTGIGISRRDQQRIFAAFTQVDSETTREYGGTGLGLTITRHLVDCFGGELRVTSEPGAGSVFEFELLLPIVERAATVTADETRGLRGLSALIVDDSEASLESLTRQAAAWGIDATAVGSGQAAVERLRAAAAAGQAYDFALIDALMPGVDGFTIASRLLAMPGVPTTPILMASATDRLEFGDRYAAVSHIACVQKPVSQSQLLDVITHSMGGENPGAAAPRSPFDQPMVAPLTVLIVEDTQANQRLVERVLAKRGHAFQTAVNGRDAVDAFRRQQFDVVLMDVQMPIMDGLQATEAIRQFEGSQQGRAPTPIIAMTAHSMQGDRQQCLRAGMDAYLSKPLDIAKLIHAVESAGAAAPARPPLTARPPLPTQPQPATEGHAAGPPQPQPLNTGDALQRLRGDEDLLRDMTSFYLSDSGPLLQAIADAWQADPRATQRAAHSLKGLASTIGAEQAASLAAELEEAASREQGATLGPLIARLQEAHAALLAELTAAGAPPPDAAPTTDPER
ncbi:MAG: response regulator [Planctomycetota bacterium]